MTGHAHVAVAVASLACLKIPSRLQGVIRGPYMLGKKPVRMTGLALVGVKCRMHWSRRCSLEVRPGLSVRLDPEVVPLELGMTFGAVSCIVALRAGLRVVQRLKRMDFPEIRSVGFGNIAGTIIRDTQIRCDAAALVTVEAELLVMTVHTVLPCSAGKKTVLSHLVRAVGRSDA